ncbi:MAG: co-chaperone GroES [Panacagrimonas sp.]
MALRPLHDRVIVKRLEEAKKTASGILIPDSAAEKPLRALVVSVGPGKRSDDGKIHPVGVKEGETVLIGKYSGTEVKIDGDELVVLREDDIMAVIA